jgi:hypothetical protein
MKTQVGICHVTTAIPAGRGGTVLKLHCTRPVSSHGLRHRQHHARVVAADGTMLSVWWKVEAR